MRRFAGAFAFVFVASLLLASYGHCWPMLAAQIDTHSQAQDHSGHHKQHNHQTDGFGQELSVPGLQSGPVGIVAAPIAKSFAPILLAVVVGDQGPAHRLSALSPKARAGPPAFAEFHARTGRLLI